MTSHSGAVVRLKDFAVVHPDTKQVLPAVEFSAQTAEIIALLGPETLPVRQYLRNMAAIENPEKGEVEVMGLSTHVIDRLSYKELRTRIGYVIGDSSLLPIYNGLMNVMLPALYHYPERSFSTVSRFARTLLEELDCNFDIQLMPHQMSSFQQRQIQLARALILEPDIVCMEEPFYDLASDERRTFAQKVLKMQGRVHSKCIILTTNYLDFVKQYVDRFIFVGSGSVEVFPGWDAFSSSPNPEVERYLDANR
jgi:polar amino acid transport system ATP-binding protein